MVLSWDSDTTYQVTIVVPDKDWVRVVISENGVGCIDVATTAADMFKEEFGYVVPFDAVIKVRQVGAVSFKVENLDAPKKGTK